MTDFREQLRRENKRPAPAPKPAVGTGLRGSLAEKHGATPDVGTLNPVIEERFGPRTSILDMPTDVQEGSGVGAVNALVGGLSTDMGQSARYYAKRLFPDEPLSESIKRFGVKDGRLFYTDNEGQAHWAISSIPERAAVAVGPSVPAAAGFGAGMATAPLAASGAVIAPLAIAGGVGGAVEAGRQMLGQEIMDDPLATYSPVDIAASAIIESTNIAPGTALLARQGKRLTADVLEGRYDPTIAANRERAARNYGIPLTPAESTQLPSLMGRQKWLSKHPESANIMQDFYTRRDDAVLDAAERYTAEMASLSPEVAEQSARDIAQRHVANVKAQLQREAEPLYEAVYEQAAPMDPTAVIETLQRGARGLETVPEQRGVIEATINKLLRPTGEGMPPVPVTDMRSIHAIEKSLGTQLKGPEIQGQARVALTQARRQLAAMLSADDAFRQVDQRYGEMALPRDEVLRSVISAVSKIKDENLRRVVPTIFRPTVRPREVEQLFTQLRRESPETADTLLATYMDETMERALRETETGTIPNPAGKIAKAWGGTRRTREQIRVAQPPSQRQGFDDFHDVLKSAGSVNLSGSDTAFNQLETEASKKGLGLVARIVRQLPRGLSPQDIGTRVADHLESGAQADYARRMAQVFTSPQGRQLLRELKQISDPEARATAIVAWLATAAATRVPAALATGQSVEEQAAEMMGKRGRPLSVRPGAMPTPHAQTPGLLDQIQ